MRPPRLLRLFLPLAAATLPFAARAADPGAPSAVDFERQVVPIFVKHCLGCHSSDEGEGGLNLTARDRAFAGGESGQSAIAPGAVEESYLVERIAAGEMPPAGKGRPVDENELNILRAWIASNAPWPEGRKLSPYEFSTETRAGRDWWSLKKPAAPPLPRVRDQAWARTPIDLFILARLEEAGLSPNPAADRAALLRRAKFDLLGLPPTPEEIDEFVADPAENAYEKLIDRLLASPQYGERWGRHWLDVVRFAESNGYETNTARPNAWPYRDYVIRAFNDDIPYPRFILEQLAGEQCGADAATGFLVGGTHDVVASPDRELTLQQRMNDLNDMLTTTAGAFLGLTIGCAKCHEHKFDPIDQRDYYGMLAMFAGVHHGERELSDPQRPMRQQQAEQMRKQLADLEARSQALLAANEPLATVPRDGGPRDGDLVAPSRPPVHSKGNVERFTPVLARSVRFAIMSTNASEPCLDELEIFTSEDSPRNAALASGGAKATASSVFANGGVPIHQVAHVNDGQYGNSHSWISGEASGGWVRIDFPAPVLIDRVSWARDREGTFRDRLPLQYRIEIAQEGDAWRTVATSDDRAAFDPSAAEPQRISLDKISPPVAAEYQSLQSRISAIRAELPAFAAVTAYVGLFQPTEAVHRLHRGEVLQPREQIAPAFLSTLGFGAAPAADACEADRRAALARWLGSEENPLTARVMANRIWHYHFGQGIVDTPSDLGFGGSRPTHPELLDYLATEFVARGWSVKAMHRLIMRSAVYQQSTRHDAAAARVDAGGRLLWRFNPRRLEAEPLRDAFLAVSGALNSRMGGPGFDLFEPNGNYVKVYIPRHSFGPEEWRRMVYQSRPRMQQEDVFGQFDCPDSSQPLPRRNTSTTALQALNLLNSDFVLQQSEIFAARLCREAPGDQDRQVERGFRLAFGRPPREEERAAARQLIERTSLVIFCRALFNANEFLFVN